jgi:glycosyltransferase involved in cell wall biosynthesis
LKSIKIINSKRRDIVLLVCGTIEEKNFKKEIAALSPSIKLVESRRDNYILYSIADVVVLPSRSDPFPLVMVEAGTFGKPFIGGKTGGIAEFIEDGKNGLLFDPGNQVQLAEKIIYFLNNPVPGESMGNNLYLKVKAKCDYSNYFSQVESIYKSLLKS